MKIAALILGILGGLGSLGMAFWADMALGIFGLMGLQEGTRDLVKLILWAIPLTSLLGGGMAPAKPKEGGVLMLISAAGLFSIGAIFGHGFNFITGGTMIMSGVGGMLALLAQEHAPRPVTQPSNEVAHIPPPAATSKTRNDYDRAKWAALVKYDRDVAHVVKLLEPLGQEWLDEFAASYLALNNKAYLPRIVRKIYADHTAFQKVQAKAEATRKAEEAEKRAQDEARQAVEVAKHIEQAKLREVQFQVEAEHRQRYAVKKLPAMLNMPWVVIGGAVITTAVAGGVLWKRHVDAELLAVNQAKEAAEQVAAHARAALAQELARKAAQEQISAQTAAQAYEWKTSNPTLVQNTVGVKITVPPPLIPDDVANFLSRNKLIIGDTVSRFCESPDFHFSRDTHPYFVKGDFDGDGKIDYAVDVDMPGGNKAIFVIFANGLVERIVGWEYISVNTKRGVIQTLDGAVKLENDSINGVRCESSSVLYVFDNKIRRFRQFFTSD